MLQDLIPYIEQYIKDWSSSVKTIIDQVNQQIRYYDILHTRTARQIAAPLVRYMQDYVLQLEREITCSNSR